MGILRNAILNLIEPELTSIREGMLSQTDRDTLVAVAAMMDEINAAATGGAPLDPVTGEPIVLDGV